MEISRYASRLTARKLSPGSGFTASQVADSRGSSSASDQPLAKHHSQPVNDSGEVDRAQAALAQDLGEGVLSPSLQIPRNLPQEPEDARMTGGTRSLSRRLLALNIPEASFPRKIASEARRSVSAQKPKTRKPNALSAQWVGQDA